MKSPTIAVLVAIILSVSCARAVDEIAKVHVDVDSPKVAVFIDEMVSTHEFDRDALRRILSQAEIKPSIIKKISTPAECTLSWAEYRDIFITKERINAGVTFWRENRAMLERIETETGVAIPMIVGIIGVETYFGRITGNDRVLDALATLAFDYPKRADFFRNELVQFLILTREEDIDATVPVGSYAGAMGQGQFIPSSFREYAIDFDADGKRDLWHNNADAIGSVANYFKRHGWQQGSKIALPAQISGTAYKKLIDSGLKPSITPDSLKAHGIAAEDGEVDTSKVAFIEFELNQGKQYWIGFNNFYVITRYNRSPLYAMAVYQLSQEITKARERAMAELSIESPL